MEQFGAYRIEALLGRGGMGEVYRAYDTEHDRVVALKVLSQHLAADAGYRERFRREAHLAARLNEPHIVPIHRYGEIDGRLFLDMRLVPGRDVAAVLAEEGAMTPARAVSVISQTARALDSAHADGLVHRDVKPSNIIVTGSGDDEFVYLVDFGIARSTSDAQGPALTQTGAALGSFDYMAPERFLEQPIDRRVDVYALACVLFECLTAQRPFAGDGLATLMFAHLNTEPPAVSSVRPGLPAALDDVIRRGLAKDPAERYATCGEFAAAARAALKESGVEARPVPAAPPTSITPMPFIPHTVGFSQPGAPGGPATGYPQPLAGTAAGLGGGTATGYGPPPPPGAGYGPPSNPGAAYGPPSNPGAAYGPTSNPGSAYGPTSAPGGGYGPPSDPGPPGFPPAAPAPGGGRRSRLPLVLGAAAVVVVLVVVGVIALTRGGGTPTPRVASDVTTAPVTTEPTPEPTPAPEPEEDLRAIIPLGFDGAGCRTGDPSNDGELAVLDCGASTAQPGPQDSSFYLYPDAETLDGVFLRDVTGAGIAELPAGTLCPDAQGYGYWQADGEQVGRIACYVDEGTQNAFLIWTEEEFNAEAIVAIAGAGQEGLVTLMEWWRQNANSDFVRP
ncbi:serine/threonine-protein kinase [Geodermatophilus marinus]|uniref:serine/threonine-protein kinase n=1 Tax=Geodermatophilus sp. LHW52908 TaxID=2303986 RepID=UPI000E3C86BF|nr:serine/threonine-protein kinase [Geodermatophilus sp. LHW52908]RFU20665.1 serine/threonine protein kinase [Geodermatophilus sp. LHW52908]